MFFTPLTFPRNVRGVKGLTSRISPKEMSGVGLKMLKAVVKKNKSLKKFIFVNLGFNYQNYKKILLLTLKNPFVY